MSRTLILTRHAKSSWDDPMQEDHDRPLNARGRRSAEALGRWLADQGLQPDLVLSSDASRTRETWALMSKALVGNVPVRWEPGLYHAAPQEILETVRKGEGSTLLVLGHNPGIGIAAANLAAAGPSHPRFIDYPTAATTVYRFDIADWHDADWRGGSVRAFIVPRDLGVE